MEDLTTPIVLSGSAPSPITTSASRGWRGFVIETHIAWNGRFVAEYPFHSITLQTRGIRRVVQRRYAHTLQQRLGAGTIIFTPRGDVKEWTLFGEPECEFIRLSLSHSLVQKAIDESGAPPRIELLDNFGTRDLRLESLLRQMLNESRTDEMASGLYIEALAAQTAIHLLRHYSSARSHRDPYLYKLSQKALDRIVEYIDANISQPLHIDDIAAEASMRSAYFSRCFASSTGMPPHRFVLLRRIERAKTILLENHRTVAETAALVGFSTPSHFSAAFTRLVGQSPRMFRKRLMT